MGEVVLTLEASERSQGRRADVTSACPRGMSLQPNDFLKDKDGTFIQDASKDRNAGGGTQNEDGAGNGFSR